MWNRGTRAGNVFNGVKLWKRWSFYGRDEVNILPRQVSAGREIKQWKAGYYGLTIISATWLPLYCSIHASDVYCNCTNNLLPTTYTGRIASINLVTYVASIDAVSTLFYDCYWRAYCFFNYSSTGELRWALYGWTRMFGFTRVPEFPVYSGRLPCAKSRGREDCLSLWVET